MSESDLGRGATRPPERSARDTPRLTAALGWLSAAGLVGYALTYLLALPGLELGDFVPVSPDGVTATPSTFSATLAAFALLFALPLVPVVVLATVAGFRDAPHGMVAAGSFLVLGALVEIVNNLPVLGAALFPGTLAPVPPEVLLHLRQDATLTFLSYDVAGFSLIYAAFAVYAVVLRRSVPLLSWAALVSIAVFVLNLPALPTAPRLAVVLMSASVLAAAVVPPSLARLASAPRPDRPPTTARAADAGADAGSRRAPA